MDRRVYEQAMQAKDPRFDGRFFIGVKTTGIYCRPVCPVKSPQARNVQFFSTAAAAAEAGFRPCLRCRPESSPGTPAWMGTSTTVSRGLRLIAEGALDSGSIEALSDRLGVTSRHLGRLFTKHLGASPKSIAQTRRLHFAKKLLDETDLCMTDIALSSGYGSVRRFNDHFRSVYGRTPTQLRRHHGQANQRGFAIKLRYRPPYDYDGMLAFLALRATPGVEVVEGGRYRRTVVVDGEPGCIEVDHEPARHQLICRIDVGTSRSLMGVMQRVRRLFDLDADPLEIGTALMADAALAPMVHQQPGRRIAGAWDPFEIAVRAIVGQQVSVKGATTVIGRIVRLYGRPVDDAWLFPTPGQLATLDAGELSMPRARAETIRSLSALVDTGELDLSSANTTDDLVEQLQGIRGIGPWTAHYIAMRAIGDPDAFLHSDLVLLKVAKRLLGVDTAKDLLARSQAWRPWRAYAGMHLWAQAVTL